MTIAQIIIISVLFIIITVQGFRYYFKTEQKEDIGFAIYLFAIISLILITVPSVIRVNELKKEMKCPEYEKIENVYKLKE